VFSIGEFSKITGLSVKTLRFYHEQGLLDPTHVDPETGYRYYDTPKIEFARIISYLRSLDLSLEEIREILRAKGDDADLRNVLKRQRSVLETRIKRYREIVRSLDRFLDQDEAIEKIMANASFHVTEGSTAPVMVAGIRMKGRYSDCCVGFAKIGKAFGRFICGKPLLLHYDAEYHETDADFEACMPVRAGKSTREIQVRELPGGRYVSLYHLGPYEELGRSYAKILGYIRDKGYECTTPTREIYHKGPGMIFRGNPKKYLTEIQFLVAGGSAASSTCD
jgi:DNA-binding transcriptional MerR regulator/effector-binding domain-containing protein